MRQSDLTIDGLYMTSNGVLVKYLGYIIVNSVRIPTFEKVTLLETTECKCMVNIDLDSLTEVGIVDSYYGKLNERFDKRIGVLLMLGYRYFKEFSCYASNEVSASHNCGIKTSTILYCDNYVFNRLIGKEND